MTLSAEHVGRLRELLAQPRQRFVIVAHTNPDGDAVGSSLAWAEVLRGMGHEVTCIVPNKYPYFLDWMPGIERIIVFKNDAEGAAARAIGQADAIFCLDFNAVSRLEILRDTIAANTTARRILTTICRPTRVSTCRFPIPTRRVRVTSSSVSSRRFSVSGPFRFRWPRCSTWA